MFRCFCFESEISQRNLEANITHFLKFNFLLIFLGMNPKKELTGTILNNLVAY